MSPKKLLILGSTGATGQQLLAQSLEQGHDVTVFVRDASKLAMKHERLRVVVGNDIANLPALASAIRGQDVLISALGVGKSFHAADVIARGVRAIVPTMNGEGVRRLIFTSAFGVGDSYADAPMVARIFFRTLLKGVYRDKAAGEAELRASQLDWTLVQPTRLTNGAKTGRYHVGERLAVPSAPPLSRADAAEFILTQVEDRTYIRKSAVICG